MRGSEKAGLIVRPQHRSDGPGQGASNLTRVQYSPSDRVASPDIAKLPGVDVDRLCERAGELWAHRREKKFVIRKQDRGAATEVGGAGGWLEGDYSFTLASWCTWRRLLGFASFVQPGSPGGAGSYRFGCGEVIPACRTGRWPPSFPVEGLTPSPGASSIDRSSPNLFRRLSIVRLHRPGLSRLSQVI